MEFEALPLDGPRLVRPRPLEDSRGYFSRVFCPDLFGEQGLPSRWAQVNVSFSAKAGTVRGLHFQRKPTADAKYIRCVRGAILDIVVDVRAGSPTYGQNCAVGLSEEKLDGLFVPAGFAHGFQTRVDATELHYYHSAAYAPEHEGGVNPTDPALGPLWPLRITEISPRDAALPYLADLEPLEA